MPGGPGARIRYLAGPTAEAVLLCSVYTCQIKMAGQHSIGQVEEHLDTPVHSGSDCDDGDGADDCPVVGELSLQQGGDSPPVASGLRKVLAEEYRKAVANANERDQYAAQSGRALRGYPCPLCIIRALRSHLKVDHSSGSPCASSKQLKLINALWVEVCATSVSQKLFADAPAHRSGHQMLKLSANVARVMLSTSPSFHKLNTNVAGLDVLLAWVLTDKKGMRLFIRSDGQAMGYRRVGHMYYTEGAARLI